MSAGGARAMPLLWMLLFLLPQVQCLVVVMSTCPSCKGRGETYKFREPNAINKKVLVDSKWTAFYPRDGRKLRHRHFYGRGTQGTKKNNNESVDLSSTCGNVKERFNINVRLDELRDRSQWRTGWLTLEEIDTTLSSPDCEREVCQTCGGSGVVPGAADEDDVPLTLGDDAGVEDEGALVDG